MAENNYDDPAGSTQMFRAFVETPAPQAHRATCPCTAPATAPV